MTNATKHTPGPWTAKRCGGWRKLNEYVLEADGAHLADLYSQSDTREGEENAAANARLIAAAPDLLAALREVSALIEARPIVGGAVVDRVRAALTKVQP